MSVGHCSASYGEAVKEQVLDYTETLLAAWRFTVTPGNAEPIYDKGSIAGPSCTVH